MLGAVCGSGCGRRVRYPKGTGRPPLYCSFNCRRLAEYAKRRHTRTFENHKENLLTLGEAEVRRLLAEEPGYADQLAELAGTYLKPPDGRERVQDDREALQLVFRKPRSYQVIGHDSPLPPSTDIDEAEEAGDWRPMVQAALAGMRWQLAAGFIPDLREWGLAA